MPPEYFFLLGFTCNFSDPTGTELLKLHGSIKKKIINLCVLVIQTSLALSKIYQLLWINTLVVSMAAGRGRRRWLMGLRPSQLLDKSE
jgi:hypothetical protein